MIYYLYHMTHNEAVSFIQNAVRASAPENWADLGCGDGTFTRALMDLLPQGSHVTAVDREQEQLNIPHHFSASIIHQFAIKSTYS